MFEPHTRLSVEMTHGGLVMGYVFSYHHCDDTEKSAETPGGYFLCAKLS